MNMLDAKKATELRIGVRATFDAVAQSPTSKYRFPVGSAFARLVGYPDHDLSSLPAAASESFTGLAYLHPHLNFASGERVLDLGSGAGLDSLLAARAVGSAGAVTGLDFAEAMVSKARSNAAAVGATNATFVRGSAEALPFTDAHFDAVHVNGLLNLCPDKAVVVAEVYRVLKPGGRVVDAEISYVNPLPPAEVRTVDDWFR